MKFYLTRTSSTDERTPPIHKEGLYKIHHNGRWYWIVELKSAQDVIGLMKVCGEELIFTDFNSFTKDGETYYGIMIYDDYIE